MRVVWVGLLLATLLTASGGAEGAEDPPQPPGGKADPGWEQRLADARAVAAQAVGRQALDEARPALEEVVALLRTHRSGTEELAAALRDLGTAFHMLGRAADALPLFEETLQTRRALHPEPHADVATSLHDLGWILGQWGRAAEALPYHESALAMRRLLHPRDHRHVAESLANVGHTLQALGRTPEAIPLHEEALAMWRRLFPGDDTSVVDSLHALGWAEGQVGRHAAAIAHLEEAVAMARRLPGGDPADLAVCLNSLGRVRQGAGRVSDALPAFEEALAIKRRLYRGDHWDVAVGINNVALALKLMGRPAEAIPLYEEALAMRRRIWPAGSRQVAQSLNNLAMALAALGREADALPLKEDALEMYRQVHDGDHPDTAIALDNLGLTLHALGRPEDALPRQQEAVAMYRRLRPQGDWDLASSLNNLAYLLTDLDRAAEALPLHREAHEMFVRLHDGDHPDVALALDNLAGVLRSLGRPEEALEHARRSVAMRRRLQTGDSPWLAVALGNVATLLSETGASAEALPMAEEAHAMAMRLGTERRWRLATSLGVLRLRVNRPEDAVAPLEDAIAILEALRSEARGLRAEDRTRFMDVLRGHSDPYGHLLRAYVALARPRDALAVLERGRGREMLDLLSRGQLDLVGEALRRAEQAGDAESVAFLREAESSRQAADAELVRASQAALAADAAVAPEERLRLRTAEAEARRELLAALSRLQQRLKAVLPEARPLDAQAVQDLLAPDERLLAYSLGDEESFALVVSREGVDVVPLLRDGKPLPGAEIDEAVAAYRYVLAHAGSDLRGDVAPRGRDLFRRVVPDRVWAAVRGAARVYLLPHGALHAVPFETLVVAEREGAPVFWAEVGPPIAYEPSASVLAALRRRPRGVAGRPALVAVGDPVFAGRGPAPTWPAQGVFVTEVKPGTQAESLGLRPGDVLVAYDGTPVADPAGLPTTAAAATAGRKDIRLRFVRDGEERQVTVAAGPLGVSWTPDAPPVAGPKWLAGRVLPVPVRGAVERTRDLEPLPGSRVEVEGIAAVLRAALGARATITLLLGAEAREQALARASTGPRYLHLATHGLVDETEGGSFTGLALTMPTGPVPGDDGFLSLVDLLHDWRGRLEGTDLVVLSACDSTRGTMQRDESMYALPWGFLFAGARSVVGSLWRVSDASTAELMAEMYRRLVEGGGTDPLDALSAARRKSMQSHPHPYHWGAFVLVGAP